MLKGYKTQHLKIKESDSDGLTKLIYVNVTVSKNLPSLHLLVFREIPF